MLLLLVNCYLRFVDKMPWPCSLCVIAKVLFRLVEDLVVAACSFDCVRESISVMPDNTHLWLRHATLYVWTHYNAAF